MLLSVLLISLLSACGSANGASPTVATTPAQATTQAASGPGKITVQATGIAGRNGSSYSVSAFDYDWQPGATGPAIGGTMGLITSDDFTINGTIQTIDASGKTLSEDKVFDSKTYSVVFFVMPPGSPPKDFAEVRVTVKGDTTATAPKWVSWAHSP